MGETERLQRNFLSAVGPCGWQWQGPASGQAGKFVLPSLTGSVYQPRLDGSGRGSFRSFPAQQPVCAVRFRGPRGFCEPLCVARGRCVPRPPAARLLFASTLSGRGERGLAGDAGPRGRGSGGAVRLCGPGDGEGSPPDATGGGSAAALKISNNFRRMREERTGVGHLRG